MILYHGSITPSINKIATNSILHGTTNKNVVYLTDNRAYALLYIWDPSHNIKRGKHVTAWIKEGIVYYEEQFPQQLKAFYDNVKGYIYCVDQNNSFYPVDDSESMWYSSAHAMVNGTEHISNVYDELCKCENDGQLKVIRFEDVDKRRIDDLYNNIAKNIIKKGLIELPNDNDALFYQKYFPSVWEMAKNRI